MVAARLLVAPVRHVDVSPHVEDSGIRLLVDVQLTSTGRASPFSARVPVAAWHAALSAALKDS